jgi:Methyltransferase domain
MIPAAESLPDLSTLQGFLDLNVVISYRELLPFVLNHNGLLGEGAEIGVQHGSFSALLLENWQGARLYSIDPWKHFSDPSYQDVANREQSLQDEIYDSACRTLAPFAERSRILRQTSAEAAPSFADGQLDFAYIDAQHHYEAVVQDLSLWYPKIKSGGIIGGHDYLNGTLPVAGEFGVKRAVDEFALEHHLQVLNTGLFDQNAKPCYPSWFIIKP